jgi:hypothetical protein
MSENVDAEKEVDELYADSFDQLAQDVFDGVKDGFEEGLKAGIRKGVLECIDCGFLTLKKEKDKTVEDIAKKAASEGLEKMASRLVTDSVCPILKDWMRSLCDEAIAIIDRHSKDKAANYAADIAGYLKIEEQADLKEKVLAGRAKQALPSSFIIDALFNGVHKTLWKCSKDNVKECKKRIAQERAR